MKNKCDLVIPVYKSPEWVSLCVYSVFKNTSEEVLNKVYLIDDCDDEYTDNALKNIKNKYGSKVEIIKNEKNLGFIGSTNKGMKESKAGYVLLLNTDCIITKGTIEKMIDNIKDDKEIGLICPISSNAANLTLEMFNGFNFSDMNNLLEKKFKGMLFDACTVVGNCLLITRECIDKVGYLDTAYGTGYGEETDYQFKAMQAGFKAKVCIDTYVFHKSEASFGTSAEKQARLAKNRELFFSRWGDDYKREMAKYEKNDPIKYINDHLTDEDKKPNIDTAIYLNGIVQNAGGVHVVVDMVNYLAINGINANVIYDVMGEYKEIMLFNPVSSKDLDKINLKQLVATVWASVFSAKKIASEKKAKLLYFVQGYETLFENGGAFGIVDTSYKIVDSMFTISDYLYKEIKENSGLESKVIQNGINYNLTHTNRKLNNKAKTISVIMRNNVMKGDWLLIDLIKKIDNRFKDLTINVIYMNEYIEFPQLKNNNLNKILGPVSRSEVIGILSNSDIYVDASLNEGFGLTPLEAMACGNAVVVSNSFGINEYVKNGENGYIVSEVNDPYKYLEKIEVLVNDSKTLTDVRKNAIETSKEFDYENKIPEYIEYFKNPIDSRYKDKLTEADKKIIEAKTKSNQVVAKKKRKLYYLAKIVPKGVKRRLKKLITFLYNSYSH